MKTPLPFEIEVGAEDDGARLDQIVARRTGRSRRVARTLIGSGRVVVGKKSVRILSRRVSAGTRILVHAESEEAETQRRDEVKLLAVDRWIVVVDKPAGLLSETDRAGSPSVESIVPRLLAARGERRTEIRLVHRLDAGTSGVLLLARTPMACKNLGRAFAAGQIDKTYIALCAGELTGEHHVDAPLGRYKGVRHAVMADGKSARTQVTALASSVGGSLVAAHPLTGRTHQIRVHLAHLGHPIMGDRLYGGPGYTREMPPRPLGRPMLHALRTGLQHPKTNESVVYTAEPPADFVQLAAELGIDLDQALSHLRA